MKTTKTSSKKIQNAPVAHNRVFKAKLKESLMVRAEREYSVHAQSNPWFKALRFSFSMMLLTILVTQVLIPNISPSNNRSLSAFIQEAKANITENSDKIYHAKIEMEGSLYFENDAFTGWHSTSLSEQELWVAPNGDLRFEYLGSAFNGPKEDGTFEEVHQNDTNIYKIDSFGNGIDYTLLEIVGYTTKETAELGGIVQAPIYNVHPGKQNDAEALKAKFKNQITCVNKEAGEDFDGYAWTTIDKDTLTVDGVTGRASPHDKKFTVMGDLFKASEGILPSSEVISILEEVQDEAKITYSEQTMDGQNVVVISLNTADFMSVFSSNKVGLATVTPDENQMTLIFNADTYQLMSLNSETLFEGVAKQRSSTTVTYYEYLDYESNIALFEPTDEFIAGMLTTRFDQHIEDFEPGCYDKYVKLSDEEAEQWLSTITSQFTEGDWELWPHPLKVTVGYYKLPGENAVKGEGN